MRISVLNSTIQIVLLFTVLMFTKSVLADPTFTYGTSGLLKVTWDPSSSKEQTSQLVYVDQIQSSLDALNNGQENSKTNTDLALAFLNLLNLHSEDLKESIAKAEAFLAAQNQRGLRRADIQSYVCGGTSYEPSLRSTAEQTQSVFLRAATGTLPPPTCQLNSEASAPIDSLPNELKESDFTVITGLNNKENPPLHILIRGISYVLKTNPLDPEHLLNEYETNKAYQAMGISVPRQKWVQVNGKPAIISEMIVGRTLAALEADAKNETDEGRKAKELLEIAKKDLRKGFIADCLLSNYDSIGGREDNVIVTASGKAYRVDTGAGLRYRSVDSKPGKGFGDQVEEWNWMRLSTAEYPKFSNRGYNYRVFRKGQSVTKTGSKLAIDAARDIYSSLTNEEIIAQIRDEENNQKKIVAAVREDIKQTMNNRILYLTGVRKELEKQRIRVTQAERMQLHEFKLPQNLQLSGC